MMITISYLELEALLQNSRKEALTQCLQIARDAQDVIGGGEYFMGYDAAAAKIEMEIQKLIEGDSK